MVPCHVMLYDGEAGQDKRGHEMEGRGMQHLKEEERLCSYVSPVLSTTCSVLLAMSASPDPYFFLLSFHLSLYDFSCVQSATVQISPLYCRSHLSAHSLSYHLSFPLSSTVSTSSICAHHLLIPALYRSFLITFCTPFLSFASCHRIIPPLHTSSSHFSSS